MSGSKDKQTWFVRERLGRFSFANWRGLVTVAALIAILAAGAITEDELRYQHPTLSIIAMAILGGIALALVLLMIAHTENRRGDPSKDLEH